MCGITIRRPTRRLRFWPGYLNLSPRDGTRTYEPVGPTRWGTGSYKPRNIGVGLVVFMMVNLMVQLYSAMEAQELTRPTLGKSGAI